jgi:beta-lactamase regulating signal transducer with metallopeptidase domain
VSFAQTLSLYLSAQVILIVAFVFTSLWFGGLSFLKMSLSQRAALKYHYTLLMILVSVVLMSPFLPKKEIFKPIARVWSVANHSVQQNDCKYSAGSGVIALDSQGKNTTPLEPLTQCSRLVMLFLVLLGALKLAVDLRQVLRVRDGSFLLKRWGRVQILVAPHIQVPFSFWLPRKMYVVIPESLVGSSYFRTAVLHELQHHRQLDTKWVYLLWGLRLFFFPNPVIHFWDQWISEVQEFACDEALVDQKKVESQAYASCLVQVAKNSVQESYQPVCATGLIFLTERTILKRRITQMFKENQKKVGIRKTWPALVLTSLLLGATAYAAQGFVQDRRVTMSQAQALAAASSTTSGFPIVVNESVLKWLNYYLGTSDGREKVQEALNRMSSYQGPIRSSLKEYQMPEELLAVPFIESGYQNSEAKHNPVGAAGLWQFIASTAQGYGLRVDNSVDERLNVELETDAGLRLILADKLRFKDWQLALLAYNAGEKSVQQAINKTHSRDPWVLVSSGFDGPAANEIENYLPRLMAAVLILKNPSLAQ